MMQRLRAWSRRATKRRKSSARQDASSHDATSQGTQLQEDAPPPYNNLSPARTAGTASTCCPSCGTDLQFLDRAQAKAAHIVAAYSSAHDAANRIVRVLGSTSDNEALDHLSQLVNKAAEYGIDHAHMVMIDGKPAITTPAAERAAIVASYDAAERSALGVARAFLANEHYALSPVVTANIVNSIHVGARIRMA